MNRRRQQQPDLDSLTPSERILHDAIHQLQVMVSTRLAQLEGAVAALAEKKRLVARTKEQRAAKRCAKLREAGLRNIERNPELAKLLPAAEEFFENARRK